jgi:hypothetical protein
LYQPLLEAPKGETVDTEKEEEEEKKWIKRAVEELERLEDQDSDSVLEDPEENSEETEDDSPRENKSTGEEEKAGEDIKQGEAWKKLKEEVLRLAFEYFDIFTPPTVLPAPSISGSSSSSSVSRKLSKRLSLSGSIPPMLEEKHEEEGTPVLGKSKNILYGKKNKVEEHKNTLNSNISSNHFEASMFDKLLVDLTEILYFWTFDCLDRNESTSRSFPLSSTLLLAHLQLVLLRRFVDYMQHNNLDAEGVLYYSKSVQTSTANTRAISCGSLTTTSDSSSSFAQDRDKEGPLSHVYRGSLIPAETIEKLNSQLEEKSITKQAYAQTLLFVSCWIEHLLMLHQELRLSLAKYFEEFAKTSVPLAAIESHHFGDSEATVTPRHKKINQEDRDRRKRTSNSFRMPKETKEKEKEKDLRTSRREKLRESLEKKEREKERVSISTLLLNSHL